MYDTHVHTAPHSPDARSTPIQMCRAAQAAGLEGFCFTEHVDLMYPMDIPTVEIPAYLADVERMRSMFPGLRIGLGLEVGDQTQAREANQALLRGVELDFLLMSRHVVDGKDPYYPDFYEGKTRQQAIDMYLEGVLRSIRGFGAFDALAHIGYVMRTSPYEGNLRELRHADAPDLLDEILRELAQRGAALEINTSGLRYNGACIPNLSVLERFRQLGGELVTIGSDAHDDHAIGGGFDEAKALAKAAGFARAAYFIARQPILYEI